ncbi:MAG: glycoside hydrolase family 65 protein, partial [Halanaerobiaceae bacterium]
MQVKNYSPKYKPELFYKFKPWEIVEEDFRVEKNHDNETVFALGNGYMGLRGTIEEDYSGPDNTTTPGVYINGVYESGEIRYGESVPDLPEEGETLLNLADWTGINIYINDKKFDMLQGKVNNYQRILNLKEGKLTRKLVWTSSSGEKIQIEFMRFLSLKYKHIGVIYCKVIPLNFQGKIKILSTIKRNITSSHFLKNDYLLNLTERGFSNKKSFIIEETRKSDIMVGVGTSNNLFWPVSQNLNLQESYYLNQEKLISEYEIEVEPQDECNLVKYGCLYSSLDVKKENLKDQILKSLENVEKMGWRQLLQEQKNLLKDYWEKVDINLKDKLELQQAYRFNVFHLLQSTGREGKTSVPAKGLAGEYYEGHYFWETEIYILPFYIYTNPDIARNLLMYRYYTLDQAEKNARRMQLPGALYPWRTINGTESSGFFMGSTIQYHINADIAYSIYQYYSATGDKNFLYNYGAEILIQTARMWTGLGDYISLKNNKFCFNEVCGPDEYEPGENNNCYTNYMAKMNLELAVDVFYDMKKSSPEQLQLLQEKIKLSEEEVKRWQNIIDHIYLPYNEKLGIHPQDDSFLYKNPLDINNIEKEELPLVSHWNPLIIWRHQVIKQADVILLMWLQGNKFSIEEK